MDDPYASGGVAMSCPCHVKNGKPTELIYPDEQCLACCEKHFSQAWDWAREGGYVAVNRQKIIGALASAQAHCYQSRMEFAVKLRDLRHKIQNREEVAPGEWENLALELDRIVNEQIAYDKEGS